MKTICTRLQSFLDEKRVPYQTIHHGPDFTSQETAAHTGTRGKEFAKTVVLWLDDRFALFVLPAHHRVDLVKVGEELKVGDARLATEEELEKLFPDCEVGAEPPFGNLYGLPVFVSSAMTDDEYLTFNGGTHADVVRMRFDDYRRLVEPGIMDFTIRP